MGIFSWFSKAPAPDYETLLSRLASDVHDAKVHLSEIRLRERRFGFLVNLYGLALWAVWAGLWWVNGLPFGLLGWNHDGLEAKAVGGGGLLAGPIFIWLLNRSVHIYFARQRNIEGVLIVFFGPSILPISTLVLPHINLLYGADTSDAHLRKLLAEQKKQVDAIKKATNYDSTRKLLEQYDLQNGPSNTPLGAASSPSTPQRRQPETPTPAGRGGQVQQGTPRAPGHLLGAGGTPMQPGAGTPVQLPPGMTPEQAAMLQMQQMQAVQPVLPTPEKRWYDRVVDSVLGEDPSQATQSKFALVCGECFRHNGLVGSKYEWERMQWICPRCNHMNPPPISRKHDNPLGSSTAESKSIGPSFPLANPSTPSLPRQAASPRPRRPAGETATPRSSRLRQEVFSAETADDKDEPMDVDDK